jgi:alpha-galactosidase
MTNGIIEADSYYNKDITTGVAAYNYGMKKLAERCGDDMFMVLSIAPLFPSQYANARRISCDAWGEMWHTNYMMNSLSFGWWLSKVYDYNDPDHLVMGDRSEAENMSRMTTAAVTGYCMLGDNLSTKGTFVGTTKSQNKAVKFTSNKAINDVIRLGKSFRPAYGHKLAGANQSVDLFTLETEDSYYIAYFNYSEGTKSGNLELAPLGIDASKVDVSSSRELWFDAAVVIDGGKLKYNLPNDQAKLFRLIKK